MAGKNQNLPVCCFWGSTTLGIIFKFFGGVRYSACRRSRHLRRRCDQFAKLQASWRMYGHAFQTGSQASDAPIWSNFECFTSNQTKKALIDYVPVLVSSFRSLHIFAVSSTRLLVVASFLSQLLNLIFLLLERKYFFYFQHDFFKISNIIFS